MKILIDIGHPAHVHYFRNLIVILKERGHKVHVVARKRNLVFYLLNYYKIPFTSRGKGANSKLGKLLYILYADIVILRLALIHRFDTYISFSTGYPVHIGFLLRKNTVSLNDTEHTNKIHSKFTYPFSDVVVTPSVYSEAITNSRHIKINNFMEGFYLHKNYFKPDKAIFLNLNISPKEKYVLLRFISWNAFHDYGIQGLSLEQKRLLVKKLSLKYKVFISAEYELEEEFKNYELRIAPEKIHHVLYFASFIISESGTMASESAYLGTHVIYTNPLPLMGYLEEERKHNLLFHLTDFDKLETQIDKFLQEKSLEADGKIKSDKMTNDFVDSTSFMSWFIENLPESVMQLSHNPTLQNKFR